MLKTILTGYIESALAGAVYDKLDDGSFSGKIPSCTGVVAFGKTLRECEYELRSTLEEWILLGLKLGHPLPIFNDFDLNRVQNHESLAAL